MPTDRKVAVDCVRKKMDMDKMQELDFFGSKVRSMGF